MSNDLTPYEQWMKDQLQNVDVPDINTAWEQMNNLLQPGITNIPTNPYKPWFGKWWLVSSIIIITTTFLLNKDSFKKDFPKTQKEINKSYNPTTLKSQNEKDSEGISIDLSYNMDHNKLIDQLFINKAIQQKSIVKDKVVQVNNELDNKKNKSDKILNINQLESLSNNKLYSLNKDIYKQGKLLSKANLTKIVHKKAKNKAVSSNNTNNYSTSIINKKERKNKHKITSSTKVISTKINIPQFENTNNIKRIENIKYNYNKIFIPAAVILPNPNIIVNVSQQLSSVLKSKKLSVLSKKWSARVGATVNVPFAIGGREYNDHNFTSSDGSIVNFIPSLHFNIKYAFNPKWSISFAPQFFVQQVAYPNVLSAVIKAPVPTDSGATNTKIVRLANMYYSHFPLMINYNLTRKIELQGGIDLAILNKAIGYKNEKYESPTHVYIGIENSTSLTREELQTLHKFDIRALLGIAYTLGNNLHFGIQFTQAFSSYLKKNLAPALSSDPAVGAQDPIPTKSINASLQFFTRYDLNILKRKNKKNEAVNNPDQKQFNASPNIQTDSVKVKKWSIRPGLTINIPFAIGKQINTPIGLTKSPFLNYIFPSLHFDIKYAFNPKWSVGFSPQLFTSQLSAKNIIYRYTTSAVFDSVVTIVRLGQMVHSHFPISINYNINKKIELNTGIDLTILHNAIGYYENKTYSRTPPFDTIISNYVATLRGDPEYNALHKFDIRALLGITYNITNNLHCGVLFTQAFTSYLKDKTPIAPLSPSDPAPINTKNFSLNLFLKYDLNLLRNKKKNKK